MSATLWIDIDRSVTTPLTKQVYEQLRGKILKRELQAGERLPPTRKFARELDVSRNVIINVYEQLIAEGYLESREGSGTYVAQDSYLEEYKDYYSYRFTQQPHLSQKHSSEEMIDFANGIPDLAAFPRKTWAKLLRDICLDAPERQFDYGESGGIPELRQSLSRFLLRTKGIRCHPEQILVLAGASQALFAIAKLLAEPYREVILEDPSYVGILHMFSELHFSFFPVPVDEKGMQVHTIPERKKASFTIVTPSHQFPFGAVLPIQRRIKLIEYARATDSYVIENDYDGEFRYSGSPISSLHLLDPEHVIHVGTFSESLFPSIRLAYMIVPAALLESCRTLVRAFGLIVPTLQQLTLNGFIEDGHLERHINRMKKTYQQKRATVIRTLQEEFQERVRISGDSTGLYVVADFAGKHFSKQQLEDIEYHGVRVYPVEDHAIHKGRHTSKLIIGYGNVPQEKIVIGLQRLTQALSE